MYCARCGASNAEGAQICATCGEVLARPQAGGSGTDRIATYLAFAILTTVCCCPPLGVPAVFFAARVAPLQEAGNLAAARDASSKALIWSVAALIVGLLFSAVWFLFNAAILRNVGQF